MRARSLSLRWPESRLAWLGGALLLALLALAYRAVIGVAFALPTHSQVAGWLFRPSQLPAPLVIGLAGWMAWRRRHQLLSLPARGAIWLAAPCLAVAGTLFVWAHLTGAADLLLPALSAQLLALATATRGARGARALAMPAFVLLLGLRIPAPLQDEIVWQLQRWTAASTAWLVSALGGPLSFAGVTLRTPEHAFHVIDGCSGLRGILILTLVALIVRELFAGARGRLWLLLPIAPLLGFGLNLLRVAYVATSENPEAMAGMQGDHTPQGLAVLGAGTAILYALGALLARGARPREAPAAGAAAPPISTRAWLAAGGWLAILALVSLIVSPFGRTAVFPPPAKPLPEQGQGWVSEPLIGDPLFFGAAGMLHRRYVPATPDGGDEQAIEIYVGFEQADYGDTSMLSSKITWPGPDWNVESREPHTLYTLRRRGELAIATRPPSELHAVIFSWHPGDLGLFRESLRSLLALDASPFQREHERRSVRVLAFAPHGGPLVLDRAKQRLDRFVTQFREELADL